MEPLTIYLGNKNYSSWSMRPWLVLEHTGARYDEVVIALDRDDTRDNILRHSPSGRVPALRHGDRVIWESLAICEYLAEQFPEAKLWPEDAAERALSRAVSCEMHAGFAALRQALPMNLKRDAKPIAHSAEVDADIARIFDIFAQCRARAAKGPYLFGAFSIADAMFAPVITRFRSYAVPLEGVCAAYAGTIEATPSFQKWRAAALAEDLAMPRYEGSNAR